jgi:oligopeptide/dipeptide ABC transporter ATP-binding protein
VDGLTVAYRSAAGSLRACREISFRVPAGRTAALVGETGSGKSSAVLALCRLLPGNGDVLAGRVGLAGLTGLAGLADGAPTDLLGLSERAMRQVRGRDIGYVPQQPMAAFNPTATIGRQVAEPLLLHEGLSYRKALPRVAEALAEMGIHEVDRVVRSYPHELSGGMLQRAMLATALICRPKLVVADEPTSALDVTVQRQIIALLRRVQREHHTALLIVTHDLSVVAQLADEVVVLYAGRVVEAGRREDVTGAPRHPYTAALLRAMVTGAAEHKRPLPALLGDPLSAVQVDTETGCPFRYRCPNAQDDCAAAFPAERTDPAGHRFACHHPLETVGASTVDAPTVNTMDESTVDAGGGSA